MRDSPVERKHEILSVIPEQRDRSLCVLHNIAPNLLFVKGKRRFLSVFQVKGTSIHCFRRFLHLGKVRYLYFFGSYLRAADLKIPNTVFLHIC